MADNSNLLQILWSGADVLRSKMDANEYKTYLLGIIFFKYLSDSYLVSVYDLTNNKLPESLEEAQKEYEKYYLSDDKDDLLEELKNTRHFVIEPELTYTSIMKDVNNNSFKREKLQKAFNDIQESDELFNGMFSDVDLYSNRLLITLGYAF